MTIDQTTRGAVTVLAPSGRIDTTTSAALEDALRRTVDGGARELLVDLARVDYISSAGSQSTRGGWPCSRDRCRSPSA